MLLLVDNYDSFTFNLYQAFLALDLPLRVIRNDQMTVQEISRMPLSGIVLSPGPGRPEQAGICVELIKKFAKKLPILGVCLGHQALAVAFGGEIISADKIYHGKKSTIFHAGKNLFQRMSLPFIAGRYHSLVVDRGTLPDVFEVEAEDKDGVVMAIRHRDYPLFGVQFHPESILTPEGTIFLKHFVDICRSFDHACAAA